MEDLGKQRHGRGLEALSLVERPFRNSEMRAALQLYRIGLLTTVKSYACGTGNRAVRNIYINAGLLGGGQESVLRKRKLGTHKSNVDEIVEVRNEPVAEVVGGTVLVLCSLRLQIEA